MGVPVLNGIRLTVQQTNELRLFGAGGLGRELFAMMNALPGWKVTGYYDDGVASGTMIKTCPVLGGLSEVLALQYEMSIILSIGEPRIKSKLAPAISENSQLKFPVIIHPRAIIQDKESVSVGKGSILTAGVILTTDIRIGDHVLLNLNCTVGHDVSIGDCCSVMPGANIAGGATLGKNVLVGSGASILNGITIGDNVRIGSGAVVTKDVASGETVIGVPAVPLKRI